MDFLVAHEMCQHPSWMEDVEDRHDACHKTSIEDIQVLQQNR